MRSISSSKTLGRVVAEHRPPLLHELLKAGIAAFHAVAEHLVEVAHHFAHGLHLLRGHVLHLVAHLLGDVLGHLAFEQVQQFLELLLRVGVHEVVIHEALNLAADAVGQVVQLVQVALGALMQQAVQGALLLLALHVRRFRLGRRVVQPLLDAGALGTEDVVQPFLEVVHHGVQVALLQLLAALLLELLHELAQVGHLGTVSVLHTVAEQVAQGAGQVAVLQQVVGQRVHQVAGVNVKNLLRAIPLGVAVALVKHGRPPAAGPHTADAWRRQWADDNTRAAMARQIDHQIR